MTPPREQLRAQLKRDEGTGPVRHGRFYPYTDTVGQETIGYGHNLGANGLSQKLADALLDEDIDDTIKLLLARFPWVETLDAARQGALVNMCFNLGIDGLAGFKQSLVALKNGDYDRASALMLESKWAEQVGNRALRLARQIETGQWV
jgi:lysozyme